MPLIFLHLSERLEACSADKKEPAETGSVFVPARSPASRVLVGPAGRETVAAVDRLVSPRLERDLGNPAALAAGCLEHLAGSTSAGATVGRPPGLARGTAIRATAWLVGKSLHGKKFLLAGGKRERPAAINARERFICIHQKRIS
jgi:hypothetical protein